MILLTDFLFPTKYSKWRIEEIKSFMLQYDADILILSKIENFAWVAYNIDYEYMEEYYNLNDYNILIFNSKFNYLNKFNKKIDWTKFNKKFPWDYLFTKRSDFNIERYDFIYHIFLVNYEKFNLFYNYPFSKQFIHLYPWWGLSSNASVKTISKYTNLIPTQPFITEILKNNSFYNYKDIYWWTFLWIDSKCYYKSRNTWIIKVCFASMWKIEDKWWQFYLKLVDEYFKKYPEKNIEFISIWNSHFDKNIISFRPMPQDQLDDFYKKNVDIFINLETWMSFNWWPLWVEALLQWVVLITTDTKNSNNYFNFSKDMMLIIDDFFAIDSIINFIHDLNLDRNLLNNFSIKSQNYTYALFSFHQQQANIFSFINEKIKKTDNLHKNTLIKIFFWRIYYFYNKIIGITKFFLFSFLKKLWKKYQ